MHIADMTRKRELEVERAREALRVAVGLLLCLGHYESAAHMVYNSQGYDLCRDERILGYLELYPQFCDALLKLDNPGRTPD